LIDEQAAAKGKILGPMAQRSPTSLLSLIDGIKTKVETIREDDAVSHAKLLDDISALMLAAETPLDTIYRIGHQVRLYSLPSMFLRPAYIRSDARH